LILFRYLLVIGSLFALVPVVMPWSWMAATHRWLGLGETPSGRMVEYLARSLSAFYALVGALCLVRKIGEAIEFFHAAADGRGGEGILPRMPCLGSP
jgi:hypothetical protein